MVAGPGIARRLGREGKLLCEGIRESRGRQEAEWSFFFVSFSLAHSLVFFLFLCLSLSLSHSLTHTLFSSLFLFVSFSFFSLSISSRGISGGRRCLCRQRHTTPGGLSCYLDFFPMALPRRPFPVLNNGLAATSGERRGEAAGGGGDSWLVVWSGSVFLEPGGRRRATGV